MRGCRSNPQGGRRQVRVMDVWVSRPLCLRDLAPNGYDRKTAGRKVIIGTDRQGLMGNYVRRVKGLSFSGMTESGHQVRMDTRTDLGGLDGAARPMELYLQSLMGCTGMDVVSILTKMKVGYDTFEVHAEAEKAEEHPRVYRKIHLIYRFTGDGLDLDKIRKAVDLSQNRYCPVSAMTRKAVELTHHIVVNDERI